MPVLDWQPDILAGYRRHVFELGADPDGEGDVAAVLVGREATAVDAGVEVDVDVDVDVDVATRGAVLYVHGFSDYFFQTELADFFAERGMAFYALDLRKCGRSRRPGQTAHYASDFALYDQELNLALDAVVQEHPGVPVLLLAHSTGGLIATLWLERRQASRGDIGPISRVVLNSPWLDMQGPPRRVAVMTQALRVLAKTNSHQRLKAPASPYGATLHTSGTGEWDFDLELKPLAGFPVTAGWLNAVRRAHALVQRGRDLGVPSLILRSDRTHYSSRYSEISDRADLVLDVKQIARWAGCLGGETTIVPIQGARHDVFLSLPEVRKRAYDVLDDWLARHP